MLLADYRAEESLCLSLDDERWQGRRRNGSLQVSRQAISSIFSNASFRTGSAENLSEPTTILRPAFPWTISSLHRHRLSGRCWDLQRSATHRTRSQGKVTALVFGRAANTPFGTVSNADKRKMGLAIKDDLYG
jgi:hypothetical protein